MKKTIFSVVLLLLITKLFSQAPTLSKDYYLKKSKTQKTIAWVMVGTGTALMVTSLFIKANNQNNDDGWLVDGWKIVFFPGMATTVASIPFFISSAKNKYRALELVISNQKILFYKQNFVALKAQPAITLKIEL